MVLLVAVASFFVARALADRDARRDSERRAEVAAAQIHGRVTQAASLTESLRRFMLDAGGTGVTSDQFARNALRWLSPADFPAAAWVERVPDSRRAAYERRIGEPIVTSDPRHGTVPARSRSSYLAATLVSGFPPLSLAGIDLSGEPGMAAALDRATQLDRVIATPLAAASIATNGFFLVAPAPNLVQAALRPGHVVVFVPDPTLSAAADTPGLRLAVGGTATGGSPGGQTVSRSFTEAGQRFDVIVPREPVQGPAAALPWLVVGAGLVLAALAAALGISAARRVRAQDDLDRIFTLSSDLIAVANFDGYFTRVNPAVRPILGYTEEEFLARPYLEFVHPDDREQTAAEAGSIGRGKSTLTFENRYARKDGSYRQLEWTSTPVTADRAMYGVARDVTDRRRAEADLARLAGEQAALRRVATLVARQAPQAEVFGAIAEEIGQLLGAEEIRMLRYEDDDAVVVAASGRDEALPLGSRHSLAGDSAAVRVFRTGEPARVDNDETVGGPIAEAVRSAGLRWVVATPIMVEGRLWGTMATARSDQPQPPETESRLGQFTELMATAIANTESWARAERLTEEQAALRRVATLVAKEPAPADLFASVAEEVANVLGEADCSLLRDDGDGTATAVAVWGAGISRGFRPGTRWPADGDGVIATALREGRPCRISDYSATTGAFADAARGLGVRSAVGCPILVGGRPWGVMVVLRYEAEPFPPDTETRLAQFSDLVATAIANAEAGAEVERLADEQAALRRVATLVAQGSPASAVFDAVAAEMGRLLGADGVTLSRYEPDEQVTVVAHSGTDPQRVPAGTRVSHRGENLTSLVRRSKRSARMEREHHEGRPGIIAERVRTAGARASVGAPIVVEGRLWGVAIANWRGDDPPPADTEERMAQFAQLLDTAIANAENRAELIASRARLVTASDEARRRFERDLHDGVQQRLVSLALELHGAEELAPPENSEFIAQLAQLKQGLTGALDDLRELSRGIHPAILSEGGLGPALRTVARRSPVPVELSLSVDERLAEPVEVGAYYVVSEALTNAAKHARASRIDIAADVDDGVLRLTIDDDGVGGADPARGSGLIGLSDRVAALGGAIEINSPPGGGTSLRVEFPVAGRSLP